MAIPVDRILEQVNAAAQIRTDKESSTLKTDQERRDANNAIKKMIGQYEETLIERGGTEKVIGDMVAYLASKAKSPLSVTLLQFRKDPLDRYETALRSLLDPKPPAATFRNSLEYGSRSTWEYTEGKSIAIRDLLAYYWLAASDEEMLLSAEALAAVPGELNIQERRKVLIEGEKELLITRLVEIRRAHNGDRGYFPIDSVIDEPSCPAGTFGRLFQAPLNNPISRLQGNLIAAFSWNVEVFILKKFEAARGEVAQGYQDIREKYIINLGEGEETEESKKYLEFLKELEQAAPEFLKEIEKEYGPVLMEEGNKENAENAYKIMVRSLNFANPDPRNPPRHTLIDKMNVSAAESKKQSIIVDIIGSMKERYKTRCSEIISGISELAAQLKSYDFEHSDIAQIAQKRSQILEQYNDIIGEKQAEDVKLMAEFQRSYQTRLGEEGLDFLLNDGTTLHLKDLDDTGKLAKLADIRVEFEKEQALYLEKEQAKRAIVINQALAAYLKEVEVVPDMTAEEKALQRDIDSVNEGSMTKNVADHKQKEKVKAFSEKMDDHKQKIKEYSEKIKRIRMADTEFSLLFEREHFRLAPEEYYEIGKKIQAMQKKMEIEQRREELGKLQSKRKELKQLKSVHDHYQGTLQLAREKTYELALALYNKVNDHVLELEHFQPKKKFH